MIITYSIVGWVFYRSCIKENKYEDGVYCAVINYYNPNTEKKSNYKLSVIVEDNKLIQINFKNGGWLDDSHFAPKELGRGGSVKIIDDRDYEYLVNVFKKGECE